MPLSAQEQARRVYQVGPPQSAATVLGVDTSNMDNAHKKAPEELVLEFAEIFSTGKQDLGRTDKIYHSIKTGNEFPIKWSPRCLPIHCQQEVGQLLDKMLQQGVIEPSTSPYA